MRHTTAEATKIIGRVLESEGESPELSDAVFKVIKRTISSFIRGDMNSTAFRGAILDALESIRSTTDTESTRVAAQDDDGSKDRNGRSQQGLRSNMELLPYTGPEEDILRLKVERMLAISVSLSGEEIAAFRREYLRLGPRNIRQDARQQGELYFQMFNFVQQEYRSSQDDQEFSTNRKLMSIEHWGMGPGNISTNSCLARLDPIVRALAEMFDWRTEDAAWFIFSNEMPTERPVRFHVTTDEPDFSTAMWFAYATTTLTVQAPIWIAPDVLASEFANHPFVRRPRRRRKMTKARLSMLHCYLTEEFENQFGGTPLDREAVKAAAHERWCAGFPAERGKSAYVDSWRFWPACVSVAEILGYDINDKAKDERDRQKSELLTQFTKMPFPSLGD